MEFGEKTHANDDNALFTPERLAEERRAGATNRALSAARESVFALCGLGLLTLAALGTYCLAPRGIAVELTVYVLIACIVVSCWGIFSVLRERIRAAKFLSFFLAALFLLFLFLHGSILVWILSPYLKWVGK